MQTTFEYLEKYFEGQLSEDEVKALEKRVQENQQFAKDVELARKLFMHKKKQAIRHQIAEVHNELSNDGFFDQFKEEKQESKVILMPQKNRRRLYQWGMAAAILILIAVGLTQFLRNSHSTGTQALALEEFYHPELTQIETNLDELSASGLASTDKTKKESLAEGLLLLYKDEFSRAEAAIKNHLNQYQEDPVALFYMGMCLQQQDKYAASIDYLRPLSTDSSFELQDGAAFYLALAYLKTERNTKEATNLLSDLSANDQSGFQSPATEILDMLKK